MDTIKKIIINIFMILSFLFISCKINDVKNKVFVNSNVLIILFNDGTCSYSGLLYGTYNYNSKTNELTMNYKNNMGLEKNKIYTYDKKNNCLYDEKNDVYTYSSKASHVKIER